MQLLKSQKNALYDIIEDLSLSPALFILEDYEMELTKIKHKHSDFYFKVDCQLNGYFRYEFSPSQDILIRKDNVENWTKLREVFRVWLKLLKREIEIVDKWLQLKTEMPNFKLLSTNNEGNFSYNEVIQIETKIHLLKAKIKEIPLTAPQAKVFNEKLDYCIELSKSSNKFDWAAYFVGVVTSIIIQLSVTPENAQDVWESVRHVFSNFLLN